MKGYLRKRGNKWSFTIDIGINPATGKRLQKTVSGFKTKKEAQAACSEMQQAINSQTFVEESVKLFKDFAMKWLEDYSEYSKVSSVRVRKQELNRVLKYLAYVKLKDINGLTYQNVLNELKNKGYSYNSILGTHTTARMIFKKAMENEIIKKNPQNSQKFLAE
ncbi:Arm DNA-binding domain-containing protein [Alkalihalobacillus sp. MEB130]|uniref:Arm DNA-binding domain-containing protein n=1 Tax=Alkalihalobacillus sp. MEB130 TaxID=2976704 RepID=UPI0028DDA77C|nr:Arm DNA-binding domain-containing protein [Alkalihalobacillus sp. MEB130]MDT8861018.1 Arm DNA-binding domain-containing protein [Alkalihalobacillus sp. MEB130]